MGDRKQNRTRLNDTQADELVAGIVPPNSEQVEIAVLGACLLEGNVFNEVAELLKPEMFYRDNHNYIFDAMVQLFKSNNPIDIVTVIQKLKDLNKLAEVGGAYYISKLTDTVGGGSNVKYHATLLIEMYLKRQIIKVAFETIREANSLTNDVFDIYTKAVNKIEGTISAVLKYDVVKIGDIHDKNINESIEVVQKGIKSGVVTGFRNLDNFTNGWQKSDLIILAGRPGMGKSVCGLAFALNPALNDNVPTAIFSLEMSKEQVVGRAQSNLSGINSSAIIKKQLTMEDITKIQGDCYVFKKAPIYIDDTPSLSIIDFKSKARKLVRDKGVRLIVIDYLQLMVGDNGKGSGNREQEISTISKTLKAIAKELDIPIIALSQLSRAVEARGGDKKPMLSDLRESGSIEQDADMVIFTYRPEYYGIDNYELGGESLTTDGLMCLIVAKHRAGSLGELRFGFNGELTKLENYDTFMDNKYRQTQNNSEKTFTQTLEENKDFLIQKTEPF